MQGAGLVSDEAPVDERGAGGGDEDKDLLTLSGLVYFLWGIFRRISSIFPHAPISTKG